MGRSKLILTARRYRGQHQRDLVQHLQHHLRDCQCVWYGRTESWCSIRQFLVSQLCVHTSFAMRMGADDSASWDPGPRLASLFLCLSCFEEDTVVCQLPSIVLSCVSSDICALVWGPKLNPVVPKDFTIEEEEAFEEERSRRLSRRGSSLLPDGFTDQFRQDSFGRSPSRHSNSPQQSRSQSFQQTFGSPARRNSSIDRSGLQLSTSGTGNGRRGSSPGPGMSPLPSPYHRRAGSMSSPQQSGPTPSSLSFNLPKPEGRSRSPLASMRQLSGDGREGTVASGGAGSGGQLSPVKESGFSRETTMVSR
jgi:hypothetical protein